MVTWVLTKDNQRIDTFEQPYDEYVRDGGTTPLEVLVPIEHLDACDRGEWHDDGFVYHHNGAVYTINGYIIEKVGDNV